MRDTNLINKVKKASVMTAHGYKKAVGWSEKTVDWVKEYGEQPYNSLKEGLTGEQKPVSWDIRNADDALLKYSIGKITKSKKKYKKQMEEAAKNYKNEAKDYKALMKEIRAKYDLGKKDVRSLRKHYELNKNEYDTRIGPRTERENYFLELVNKKEAAKKLHAEKNAARNKAIKRQAAVTSLQKVSDARNDLRTGSSLSSDDLYAAGNKSLAGSVNNSIKNTVKKKAVKLADKLTKGFASKLINPLAQIKRYLITTISSLVGQVLIYVLPVLVVLTICGAVVAAFTDIVNSILSFFGLGGSSDDNSNDSRQSMSSYTPEEIDQMVAEREGLTGDQEKLLRYALAQVGKEYTTVDEVNDGMSRTGPDSYDCSGLAFDVENYIGKNITAGTAASQAEMLMNQGKYLQDTSIAPQVGDLIYYADPPDAVRDKNKDKWNYVYHVAIYAGNGYVVEAYGDDEGVIYGPLRSKNAFAICTP